MLKHIKNLSASDNKKGGNVVKIKFTQREQQLITSMMPKMVVTKTAKSGYFKVSSIRKLVVTPMRVSVVRS
jgi:hypothetical protein